MIIKVEIPAGPRTPIPADLAIPDSKGPWPGVLVVHDAGGVTDDLRAICERIASAGYVASAPDLYHWGATPRCVVSTMRTLRSGQGRAMDELIAAGRWLGDDERCTGPVGVVGFCMGGGFALLLGPTGEFAATAPNYGMLPSPLKERLTGTCPVVASYGGKDFSLRKATSKLEHVLEELGVEHDVKEYPESSHSFMNHFSGPIRAFEVLGFRPNDADAEDAWARIFDFFGRHLDADAASG